MKIMAKTLLVSAVLSIALGVSFTAARADQKQTAAVAAPNMNIGGAFGVLDRDTKFILSGEGTMPLFSDRFGVQLDGADATGEGDNIGAIALHLFTRDPSSYLLGVTALWGANGSIGTSRFGGEGELYWDRFTFRLAGGVQNKEGDGSGYGQGKAAYYFTDNFVLHATGFGASDMRGGSVGGEWKPDWNPSWAMPFSVFAEGGDTDETSGFGLVGLRFSFGDNNASLKDRNRSYDPDNMANTFITDEHGGGSDDECVQPHTDGGGSRPPHAIDGGGPSPCGHGPI